MGRVGGTQDIGALLPLGGGQAVVDVIGDHHAEDAVATLGVVPTEESLEERLGLRSAERNSTHCEVIDGPRSG